MRQKGFAPLIILLIFSIVAAGTVVTYSVIRKTNPTSIITKYINIEKEDTIFTPTPTAIQTYSPVKTSPSSTKPTSPTKTTTPKPTTRPTSKPVTSTPTQTSTANTSNTTTATPFSTPTATSAPTITATPSATTTYTQATSCSSVSVSGATYGGVVNGKNLYFVSSGATITINANTTPANGVVNWKIASVSSALPNGGSFSANNMPTVSYTAPTNTSGSDQGVEIRGDISEYPNAALYCPPFTIGVHSN